MSDAFVVSYSLQARDDLRNIYAYIAFELHVPNTAKSQVDRIRDAIQSLDMLPERYGRVLWEPWKSRNTHRVPVDNYVVYYLVDSKNKTVTILRIFYGGQDIRNILK